MMVLGLPGTQKRNYCILNLNILGITVIIEYTRGSEILLHYLIRFLPPFQNLM